MNRALFRYHGGKVKLAPWIIKHFPQHKTYVEPYCGAASVLFAKPRSYAEVVNDLDGEVVNVFRILRDRDRADELAFQVALTPFARDEFDLSYGGCDDDIEQARRTLARAAMGFSDTALANPTGFRNNTSREGSIPAHDWASFPEVIPAFVERLRGVIVENMPALDVIIQYDAPDTLLYVDPPYVISTRGAGQAGNYRHEMSDDDHRELAAALNNAAGMVILSGYPSLLYEELYPGWRMITRKAYADGADERTEALWLNPRAANAGQQRLF